MKIADHEFVSITCAVTLIVSLSYAIARYILFAGVGFEHLPLYVLNKSIAFTAVVMIGLSFLSKVLHRQKSFGILGFGLAALHAVISIALFGPAYYPDFFETTGKLIFNAELAVLFGILALFGFLVIAVRYSERLSYAAFALILPHVTFMGYGTWFKPAGWPGHLPPITLAAFIVILMVFYIYASRRLARKE